MIRTAGTSDVCRTGFSRPLWFSSLRPRRGRATLFEITRHPRAGGDPAITLAARSLVSRVRGNDEGVGGRGSAKHDNGVREFVAALEFTLVITANVRACPGIRNSFGALIGVAPTLRHDPS